MPYTKDYLNPKSLKSMVKSFIGKYANVHTPGNERDILIFAQRRSGGTWLMELFYSQPGFKYSAQPLDLGFMNPHMRKLPHVKQSKFINLDGREQSIVKEYISNILNNRIQVNPPWRVFDKEYNFFTNRYVLKLTHAHPLINWFADNFNCHIIYLVRHPIPTALSIIKRGWNDFLDTFITNRYYCNNYLTAQNRSFVKQIQESGTELEIFVLEWCLENLVPLRSIEKEENKWLALSYEELVIEPERIINLLYEQMQLPDKRHMLKHIKKASKTANTASQQIIKANDNLEIIGRWRQEISSSDIVNVNRILTEFAINAYTAERILPHKMLLHFPTEVNTIDKAFVDQ